MQPSHRRLLEAFEVISNDKKSVTTRKGNVARIRGHLDCNHTNGALADSIDGTDIEHDWRR